MGYFSNALFLLQLFPCLIHAIYHYIEDGGTQFIYYNGTINGTFTTHGSGNGSYSVDYETYCFSHITDSSLRIGVNPPWDSNPFVFDFLRGNDRQNSRRRSARSTRNVFRRGSCTNYKTSDKSSNISMKDTCLNLFGDTYVYFSSAYYLCANPCVATDEQPLYSISAEMVNLSAATVTRVNDVLKGGTDLGPFYEVKGDEKTWVSNGTVKDNLIQIPWKCCYIYDNACQDSILFKWNYSTPFTYNINFTNTTSVALFTLSAPAGNITLSFSGTRLDGEDSEYEPLDIANYSAISLAPPSNYSLPHFTFANGSEFVWHKYSTGNWDARAAQAAQATLSSSRRELPTLGTLWCVVLGGIALVFFS